MFLNRDYSHIFWLLQPINLSCLLAGSGMMIATPTSPPTSTRNTYSYTLFFKMKQILTDDFQVCATHKNRPRAPPPRAPTHPGSYSSSNLTAELRSSSRPLAELPHHKEDSGFILFSQASCLWT